MRYRFLVALPILILSCALGRASAQTGPLSYLKLAPQEGHPGDPIYVTGAGFKPGAAEAFTMACPDALTMTSPGDYEVKAGPKADAQGRFVGFKINAVAPPNLTIPLRCTIYANVGDSQFGPDVKGRYTLIPPSQKLDPFATHITGVHVATAPVRVRYGVLERIAVHDGLWPGAYVTVGLHYGAGRQEFRRRLDFQGATLVRLPIHVRVGPRGKPMRVAVNVHLQLGPAGGTAVSSFFVIH